MKTKIARICSLSMAAGGVALASGCVVVPYQQPVYQTEAVAMVPENYVVVDGVNVGIVGGQYYILSGGVWIIDREHYSYYHGWFHDHPTYWREHAMHNELYRRDAHGREKPIPHDRRDPSGRYDQHGQPGHGDPRVQPGHDNRNVPPGNGGQRPNVGTGQPKQQQPQPKGQPQQKPQPKKTTDKDQKTQ